VSEGSSRRGLFRELAAAAARAALSDDDYERAFATGRDAEPAAVVAEALAYIASAVSGWVSDG
jgi:hypothetical protein